MEYQELLSRYNQLLEENKNLKEENRELRVKLGEETTDISFDIQNTKIERLNVDQVIEEELTNKQVNKNSTAEEKIKFFMSLFRGRTDVYAKRWESKKTGKSGYSPVCRNEWRTGVCLKPKASCNKCSNKDYETMDMKVIEKHLRGQVVAGIYPLLEDETCYFVAIDFDDEGYKEDVMVVREVCTEFNIPVAVERSRSGDGAHAWIFFDEKVAAVTARKLGSAILTYAMNKRHEIKFKSYDRLFPNQDTMPKGGFGNLIALPFQYESFKENNSVFIDDDFNMYQDQWKYLSGLQKLSSIEVESLIIKLCGGNVLGELKSSADETKPWEHKKVKIEKSEFPERIVIVRANMLFIPKDGISHKALNYIMRLAAFKNPEFYKKQAIRLSTNGLPRIISCADETQEYVCLPRGLEDELRDMFKELDVQVEFIDKTNKGRDIDVEFNGELREEQPKAAERLLTNTNGILCGTTAFGKTVVAINLIAERKTNTLVLVDKVSLAGQWRKRIEEFLTINEKLPEEPTVKKRGRKKERSIIGQLGAGKNDLSGVIDIAIMQSVYRENEVKDLVKDYGMVIVDECHHVSAVSFENILKEANAKYVYGLTATPTRKDGHHPIIFMQCGPIRYRDDAKVQAKKRDFDHYIIPRFTSFRVPVYKNEKEMQIQDIYADIVESEARNNMIVEDVIKASKRGRNCLVITERTAHVDTIADKLKDKIKNVISLTGGMGRKATREIMTRISEVPESESLVLVATGKYVGEGFDSPRLDTLFLAMPISWKGTLAQYAGRLHRSYESKKEVLVYDYVDMNIGMLERMYNRRLSGYAAIGYKARGNEESEEKTNVIFNKANFLSVYTNDIIGANKEIIISTPYMTKKRVSSMLDYLKVALDNKVKVIVITNVKGSLAESKQNTFDELIKTLKEFRIDVILKENIHQKFAIIDQKTVWYGSINLLSYGSAEGSMMRLDSVSIADELLKNVSMKGCVENESKN